LGAHGEQLAAGSPILPSGGGWGNKDTMKQHWTRGDQKQRDPTGFLVWLTACKRWVLRTRTAVPDEVTCKRCRRYLDKLAAN